MLYPLMLQFLAAKEDYEDWLNLLVVVVLVVFWIIGGILKAVSQKAKRKEEPEEQQRVTGLEEIEKMLGVSRPEVTKADKGKIQEQKQRIEDLSREAVSKQKEEVKQEVRTSKGGSLEPKQRVSGRPMPTGRPSKTAKGRLGSASMKRSPIYKPSGKKRREDKEKEPESVFESLEIAEPEDLRKAILHYEILGKPKSLR